ncbi:MAG: S8 family serine peptidase [Tumebacillaceae bacterium]
MNNTVETQTDWKSKLGTGIRIVVMDSGVNVQHQDLQSYSFSGLSIQQEEEGVFRVTEDIQDTLGHGTAVSAIIKKLVPQAEIFAVKVFQDELETNLDTLLYALEQVEKVECHILHLSLGVTQGDDIPRLREICERLTAKGVIIVSAFDNDGAISYPAAFPNVIGVDASMICKTDYDYEFVESPIVNLRAKGSHQRLAWVEPKYIFRAGASFAAPYVSGYAAKLIESGVTEQAGILDELKQAAMKLYPNNTTPSHKSKFAINKAVVFPFNKEMHSIARFQDLLTFDLHAICDTKYSGQVGQPISKILRTSVPNDVTVENIDNLDWNDDFDTFVLGHVELLSEKIGVNFIEMILEKCIEHGKNVYCFDGLSRYEELVSQANERGIKIFYPQVDMSDVPVNRFGKLRKIGKPVLGVFGTSSRQGKFTLQMNLRRKFLRDGYGVGQLGTEPSALLYGFQEVYPMGYNSTVQVHSYQAVQVLNEMMGRIEDTNPDIILVGSQSGTVPYETGNLSRFTFPAIDFVLGTQPDAYILCANLEDEVAYVKRAVQVLENLGPGKVVGLAIFPLRKQVIPWAGVKMDLTDRVEIEDLKKALQDELGIEAYALNSDEELEALYQKCLDFYS